MLKTLMQKELNLHKTSLLATLSVILICLMNIVCAVKPELLKVIGFQYPLNYIQQFHYGIIIPLLLICLPMLFGIIAISEERRFQTLEWHHCLPPSKSKQFYYKCGFVYLFSVVVIAPTLFLYDENFVYILQQRVTLSYITDLPIQYLSIKGLSPVILIVFMTSIGIFCSSVFMSSFLALWGTFIVIGVTILCRFIVDPMWLTFPVIAKYPKVFLRPGIHYLHYAVLSLFMVGLARYNFNKINTVKSRTFCFQLLLLGLLTMGMTEISLRYEYSFRTGTRHVETPGLSCIIGGEDHYLVVDYSSLVSNKLQIMALTEADIKRAIINIDPLRPDILWHIYEYDLSSDRLRRLFPRIWNKSEREEMMNIHYHGHLIWKNWRFIKITDDQKFLKLLQALFQEKYIFFCFKYKTSRYYMIRVFRQHNVYSNDLKRMLVKFPDNNENLLVLDESDINDQLHIDYALSPDNTWFCKIINNHSNEILLTKTDLSKTLDLSPKCKNFSLCCDSSNNCFSIKNEDMSSEKCEKIEVKKVCDEVNIWEFLQSSFLFNELAISPDSRFLAKQRIEGITSTFSFIHLDTSSEHVVLTSERTQQSRQNIKEYIWSLWFQSGKWMSYQCFRSGLKQYFSAPMTWSEDNTLAILFNRKLYLFSVHDDCIYEELAAIDVSEVFPPGSDVGPKARIKFWGNKTILLANYCSIWKLDLSNYR